MSELVEAGSSAEEYIISFISSTIQSIAIHFRRYMLTSIGQSFSISHH